MERVDVDQTLTADDLAAGVDRPLALHVLTGPTDRRWIRLRGASLVLGRQPTEANGIAIDDPRMSRDHAKLERLSDGVYSLSDCNSKNGTFCNGQPAQGTPLARQDVVRVGDTVMLVAEEAPRSSSDHAPLLGQSQPIAAVREILRRTASSQLSILFLGETGTGKGVCARWLHQQSQRSGEFIAVNCAAIPPQLIERELFGHVRGAYTGADRSAPGYVSAADGGTLFLDEIGELPLDAQAKLLAFLEDRAYRVVGSPQLHHADVRVLAATNRDLEQLVHTNQFRSDLLARLEQVVVRLPSLRERKEDLMLLTYALMERQQGRRFRCSPDVVEALALHDWPRNVRELATVLQRVPYLRDGVEQVELTDLPSGLQSAVGSPLRRIKRSSGSAATPSRTELATLLTEHQGNVSQIADAIGRDRRQVYRWLKSLNLDPTQFRKE